MAVVKAAVADSTRRVYNSAQIRYRTYCVDTALNAFPMTVEKVLGFLHDEAMDHPLERTAGTIKTYRSALSLLHIESIWGHLPNPTSDILVTRYLTGLTRVKHDSDAAKAAARATPLNLGPSLMIQLEPWVATAHRPGDLMHWAATTLGAFGGLRISELLGSSSLKPSRRLRIEQITFIRNGPGKRVADPGRVLECGELPSHYLVALESTKADQLATNPPTPIAAPVAVRAMWRWRQWQAKEARTRPESALFFHVHDLTQAHLFEWITRIFVELGEGEPHLTGKSFRRGAASDLVATCPLTDAALITRHASLSMPLVYASSESKQERAIAISRAMGT